MRARKAMWANPRMLNAVAVWATGVAAVLLLVAGARWVAGSSLFPLREVSVYGSLFHTPPAVVERTALARIQGGFFAVDLGAVRAALEALPWVRRVAVRRIWPDRIEVTIEEHVPLARWVGEPEGALVNTLVNSHGERFHARVESELPSFAGPPGSEAQITRRYRAFAGLLAPLRSALHSVSLTPRHAWQLRLEDGLHIALGRDTPDDSVERRLARFVSTSARLDTGSAEKRPAYVDLRYPNGYALRGRAADRVAKPVARAKG